MKNPWMTWSQLKRLQLVKRKTLKSALKTSPSTTATSVVDKPQDRSLDATTIASLNPVISQWIEQVSQIKI